MSQLKKGALLSYVTIILTNLIGLLLTPFIVRSLGNSEYGLYALIGAFIGYISVLDLGLNNTIVRYVSKYRAENDKEGEEVFLGTTMLIYAFISFIVILIGFSLYYNLDVVFSKSLSLEQLEKAKVMFIILIFNLAISLPGGSFAAICNAYEHFVFPRTVNIIRYIFRSLLVVFILKLGADSIGLVLLDTVINIIIIGFNGYYVFYKLKVIFKFKRVNKTLLYEIFSYSVWIFIFALIGQFQWQGGQLIVGAQLNTVEVAIYAIGIMLGTYYGAFSAAISSVFLPRATQMIVNNSSTDALLEMLSRVGRFALLSLQLIFSGFIVFGKQFILLWLGEGYSKAYYIAIVIMIAYTIPLIQTFANSLLEAQKLFKFKAVMTLFFISLGTIIGYFTVNTFGIIAVIISICSCWMISQIIMNVYFYKILGLNMLLFFKNISKGFLVAFVLCLVLGFIINFIPGTGWLNLFLKIGLYFSTYVGVMYFIGINQEEKLILTSIVLKAKNKVL